MSLRIGGPSFQTGAAQASAAPARFRLASAQKVPIKEPSDVVALPGGAFLVVGDKTDKLALVRPDGSSTTIKLEGIKNGKSGLEAIAYDPRTRHLMVVSEEKGRLFRYAFDPAKGTARLEKKEGIGIKGKDNKGVEGMVFLPGERSPTGRPQLLVAKEGKPRALALLEADGGGKPHMLELDGALKEACMDFSGLALDPLTGRVWVSSEDSAVAAELKLVRRGGKLTAELVRTVPLRDERGEPLQRVEGLTFDARGDLLVLLEDDRKLVRFART